MEILHLLLSHLMEICCSVSGLDIAERLVLLLPPLEKAADILRLTLSHLPRELWGGKLKDEALQLLRDVSSCIVLPLITACTRHVSALCALMTSVVCVCVFSNITSSLSCMVWKLYRFMSVDHLAVTSIVLYTVVYFVIRSMISFLLVK